MAEIYDATTIDDDELLSLCLEEQRQSIGFENDGDLSGAREKSLEYYKGEMPDVPSLPNRSRAVSTDVADAIETVLPDLVEIFIGGEDVATFQARNPQDEDAAKQETDYVNHVVVQENNGFDLFYTTFKDALLTKTGVFRWCWEAYDKSAEEHFTGFTQDDCLATYQAILAKGDPYTTMSRPEPESYDQDAAREAQMSGFPPAPQTYSFKVAYDGRGGCVKVDPVVPEDFTVARDTVRLRDTTYCAMRTRPRAQELLKLGFDADKVARLPPYGAPSRSDAVGLARDTAGEETQVSTSNQSNSMLRQVQVIEHIIRLVGENGKEVIWRVLTGGSGEQGIILDREIIDHVPYSAITPYPMTHRFYGRSMADLLIQIQQIKTALVRMLLDSGYFALNQRLSVDMSKANDFTIGDLLRNEPGIPVRMKAAGAVEPIQSPGLGFDAAAALEVFSVAGEQRTGALRAAQGLDPDTLHDTARGAMAMLSNGQKRIRMIARIFAESGVKDMFLGVHATIRTHSERADEVRLLGSWVQVDPTQWSERDDMTIELGIGSGGQAQELQSGQALLNLQEQIFKEAGQSGIVTPQNLFNAANRFVSRALGVKSPQQYLTDPSVTAQQQAAQPPLPPPPDPKMIEAQGKLALAQQQQAADAQAAQAQFTADQQQAAAKQASDERIAMANIASDAQLEREQIAADLQIKREQIAAEQRTELMKAQLGAQSSVMLPDNMGGVPGGPVGDQMGGAPAL